MRSLWRGRRQDRERELEEELEAHFTLDVRERMQDGLDQKEAEFAARREFGNVTRVKEITRQMWGWSSFELWQDVRFGLRTICRDRGFFPTAVLPLALGDFLHRFATASRNRNSDGAWRHGGHDSFTRSHGQSAVCVYRRGGRHGAHVVILACPCEPSLGCGLVRSRDAWRRTGAPYFRRVSCCVCAIHSGESSGAASLPSR